MLVQDPTDRSATFWLTDDSSRSRRLPYENFDRNLKHLQVHIFYNSRRRLLSALHG